jgi:hypothetical protein
VRQIVEITQKFETSRPVFRLTLERGDKTISANIGHPVYRYRPEPEEGNVISQLACGNFAESFSARDNQFTVDAFQIAQRTMQDIRSSMVKFLEVNLEMRSPKQSKIYRWYYRNLPDDSDFNDALVMLYKYMRSFCNEDMRSSNIEHTNNTIALLEAIMGKYDQK